MRKRTTQEQITLQQFHALTRPLIGLCVSRIWRGYGTAIFFELGDLAESEHIGEDISTRTTHQGQSTVDLEIGWRVERMRSIFFGSSSGDRKISNGLGKLQGLEVVDITVQGRLPELAIQLSCGFWLQSLTTWEGQHEWTLFFNENVSSRKWLMSRNGKVVLVTSGSEQQQAATRT